MADDRDSTSTLYTPDQNPRNPRVVIYGRVSDDESGEARSVTEQVDALTREVTARGWDLVDTVTDVSLSASRYARKPRPGWQRVTHLVDAGDVDVVAVWELSRSTRRVGDLDRFADLCEDRGVVLLVRDRVVDPGNDADRLTLGVLSVVDAGESRRTRTRVLRAVAANASAGRPHGKHLYGYRRRYDPTSGRLVEVTVDPAAVEVIRDVAAQVAAGVSLRAVVRDLNDRGVPTPRAGHGWETRQVKRMLLNPAYRGQRVHQGRVIGEAAWPPILDPATAAAVDEALTAPDRGTFHGSDVVHFGSGLLLCAGCGRTLRHLVRRNGGPAYTCITPGCFQVSVKAPTVEGWLRDYAVGVLSRPDAAAVLFPPDAADRAAAAAVVAAELRARLDAARDAYAAGRIPIESLTAIESALGPRLVDAEAASQGPRPVAVPASALTDPAGTWEGMTPWQRREMLRVLCGGPVTVARASRGYRGPVGPRLSFPTRDRLSEVGETVAV